MNYSEEIPKYADVMTSEEWNESVECGMFTNYDGVGYFCKDGKMDTSLEVFSIEGRLKSKDATHVAWFNK